MLNLTKNQIYIISAVVVAIIAYFMFFRKKKVTKESNYYGDNWGWQTGPQPVSSEQAMQTARGSIYDSVAGTMESNYSQDELTGGAPNFESNYSQAMLQAGSGTDFLSGYAPKNAPKNAPRSM